MNRRHHKALALPIGWTAVVALGASLPSCLFLEDFGDLQEGTGGGAAGTTSSSASSASSSTGASSSSSGSTGSTGSSSASSSSASSSSASSSSASSSSSGGGASSSSSGGGGTGGSGGEGPGLLSTHGNVVVVRSNDDACSVEVTDFAVLGGEVFVVGVTTALGEEECFSVPISGDNATPGRSTSWWARFTSGLDALLDYGTLAVADTVSEVDVSPARLAVASGSVFAAFDGGIDDATGDRVAAVRDVTNDVDYRLLATGDVLATDLFAAAGRVYLTGIVDGDTTHGGACATGDSERNVVNGGFVWSIDDDTCELGTFGDDTAIWSGIASNPVSLAVGGQLDFACLGAADQATLRIVDVDAVAASAMADSCARPSGVGDGDVPFPFLPMALAATTTEQIASVRTDSVTQLVRRSLPSGSTLAPVSFTGNPQRVVTFATPQGTIGAVGRFSGALSYGALSVPSTDGRAGFFVTFDGESSTSFVLDAASDGGPFDETFTAALGTSEGLYIAGQWQQGLEAELGFTGDDADPFGTAAFFTVLPGL